MDELNCIDRTLIIYKNNQKLIDKSMRFNDMCDVLTDNGFLFCKYPSIEKLRYNYQKAITAKGVKKESDPYYQLGLKMIDELKALPNKVNELELLFSPLAMNGFSNERAIHGKCLKIIDYFTHALDDIISNILFFSKMTYTPHLTFSECVQFDKVSRHLKNHLMYLNEIFYAVISNYEQYLFRYGLEDKQSERHEHNKDYYPTKNQLFKVVKGFNTLLFKLSLINGEILSYRFIK